MGYQPKMSKLIFPEPGCKKIVFWNQIIEFQTVLCLLTFDYALAQGFLNRLGHRNHLWVLVLEYRFSGLPPGNSVSIVLGLGQQTCCFN